MDVKDLDFQEIYAAYQPKILRYMVRLVGEREAEDLTQDVFLKVSQALGTFRGESKLSTWIYRIASNAAIDKIRNSSSQRCAEDSLVDDPDEAEDKDAWTGDQKPSLERQIMRKEMVQCFGNYVENLPVNYQTVFALSELGELTNNEIAEVLGLNLNVVKIRLHRGRVKLLRELKTHCKAEEWL
jgi:RNA polymerase sigma-70 factor (ECF subfamily)